VGADYARRGRETDCRCPQPYDLAALRAQLWDTWNPPPQKARQVIPDAAVEAAWDKLHENPIRPIGIDYAELQAALEAAAPHMLREAWELGYHTGGAEFEADNPYRSQA